MLGTLSGRLCIQMAAIWGAFWLTARRVIEDMKANPKGYGSFVLFLVPLAIIVTVMFALRAKGGRGRRTDNWSMLPCFLVRFRTISGSRPHRIGSRISDFRTVN